MKTYPSLEARTEAMTGDIDSGAICLELRSDKKKMAQKEMNGEEKNRLNPRTCLLKQRTEKRELMRNSTER